MHRSTLFLTALIATAISIVSCAYPVVLWEKKHSDGYRTTVTFP